MSNKKLIILAGAGALLFAVCAFRRTPIGHVLWPPLMRASVSDVPVFDVPPGFDPATGWSMDIVVRVDNEGRGGILISRQNRGAYADIPTAWPVYRYDGKTRTLTSVKPSEWRLATGPVTSFDSDNYATGDWGLHARVRNGVLVGEIRQGPDISVAVKGKFGTGQEFSPVEPVVAILTAEGPRRPKSKGGMVFTPSFGGGFYGQHYVSLFRLPEMTPIGEAVRIAFRTVDGIESPTWSSDGRFLVYTTRDGRKMCVIHIDQEEPDGETD